MNILSRGGGRFFGGGGGGGFFGNSKNLNLKKVNDPVPRRHFAPRGGGARPHPQEVKGQPPNQGEKMDPTRLIFRPALFTAVVSTSSITACTIWQYEEYRKSLSSSPSSRLHSFRDLLTGSDQSQQQPARRRSSPSTTSNNPLTTWWTSLTPGEKIFWPICGANVLVWALWRVPSFAPFMVNYFSSTPVGRHPSLPLLLSTFSHYSFIHLAANMFVLHSFVPAASQILGKEQLLAFYLTSGTVASFGSHLHKLFVRNGTPSLGASGAIMGLLGLVCTRMPDIQLGVIFLPGVSFSADSALKTILTVDTAGILLGWRFMDHAAHLSGALFGIAFSSYAGPTFWAFRDWVMTNWHRYRSQSGGSGPS